MYARYARNLAGIQSSINHLAACHVLHSIVWAALPGRDVEITGRFAGELTESMERHQAAYRRNHPDPSLGSSPPDPAARRAIGSAQSDDAGKAAGLSWVTALYFFAPGIRSHS
jgi:hypothetical protein